MKRKITKRAVGLLLGAAFAAACGPEGKEAPPDLVPPESRAYVSTGGADTPLGSTEMLLGAARATVRIEMTEPGRIHYTRNGQDPQPGQPGTGSGGQTVLLSLDQDTDLRWTSVDDAGNAEGTVHRATLRFDHTPPTATIDPEPVGQDVFPGPIVVRITVDEPATIYYTLDGTLPVPDTARTQVAEDAVDIPLAHPTTLSIRVLDAARNVWGPRSFRYLIDDVAPRSEAEPPGGDYLGPVPVELAVDDPSATIHFTLDGTEPDDRSPVWEGGQVFSETAVLKFRAIDPGGNQESVRTETYTIGPLGAREPVPALGAETIDVAGNLDLAAALLEAAGPWSGRAGVPERAGLASELYAAGRTVSDAVLLQSHGGYSALYAPLNVARAGGAAGAPDRDGNGSNLEETQSDLLSALASASGTSVPLGIYPLVLPFEAISALLLRDPGTELREDGLPLAEDDYGLLTWEGTPGPKRVNTAATLHATLRALAARARVALAASHPVGADAYSTVVAPIVASRCLGCHRPGAIAPALDDAEAVRNLVVPGEPGESRLLDLLSLTVEHPNLPATSAQLALVADWIESDAPPPEDPGTAPGLSPREGLLGVLSVQQSAWTLDWIGRQLGLDPTTGRLSPLGTNGVRYLPAAVRASDNIGLPGLPRQPESFSVTDDRYELEVQARGLGAALRLVELLEDPALDLRAYPLDTDEANLSPRDYARNAAGLLLARAWDDGQGYRSSWRPSEGLSDTLSAAAAGEAMAGLAAAKTAGLAEESEVASRVEALRGALEGSLLRSDGWYHDEARFDVETPRGRRPSLAAQLAVLRGTLALAAAGDAAAGDEARRLWGRLEAFWDAESGAFQTALGDRLYTYTPALAAQVVDTLGAASQAGLAEAEARLETFCRVVVLGGLLASETWLGGEVASGPDDDRDGVLKPGDIPVGHGVGPSFRREIRFE